MTNDHPDVRAAVAAVEARTKKLLAINGKRTPDSFHRELGQIIWDYCGMARTEAGLKKALELIPVLREQFWSDVKILGSGEGLNQTLEKAGRLADFFELGELMCRDALERAESCGGHFREESQTPDGEAKRDDSQYSHVAAWEWKDNGPQVLHKEALEFEYVKPSQRNYA